MVIKLAKLLVFSCYGKWTTNSVKNICDLTMMTDYCFKNCNGRKAYFMRKQLIKILKKNIA